MPNSLSRASFCGPIPRINFRLSLLEADGAAPDFFAADLAAALGFGGAFGFGATAATGRAGAAGIGGLGMIGAVGAAARLAARLAAAPVVVAVSAVSAAAVC